jgi:hypothetical protein
MLWKLLLGCTFYLHYFYVALLFLLGFIFQIFLIHGWRNLQMQRHRCGEATVSVCARVRACVFTL